MKKYLVGKEKSYLRLSLFLKSLRCKLSSYFYHTNPKQKAFKNTVGKGQKIFLSSISFFHKASYYIVIPVKFNFSSANGFNMD